MKLRKIGNSLGTTFGRELLLKAGFSVDDELAITATHGELQIRRSNAPLLLELTQDEAEALANGTSGSKAGITLAAKARQLLHPPKSE